MLGNGAPVKPPNSYDVEGFTGPPSLQVLAAFRGIRKKVKRTLGGFSVSWGDMLDKVGELKGTLGRTSGNIREVCRERFGEFVCAVLPNLREL